jgi:hypothetical protein
MRAPALWAWLELSDEDATFSDNFVHVRPGVPVAIEVTPNRNLGVVEFKRQLRVRSLFDTYDQGASSSARSRMARGT